MVVRSFKAKKPKAWGLLIKSLLSANSYPLSYVHVILRSDPTSDAASLGNLPSLPMNGRGKDTRQRKKKPARSVSESRKRKAGAKEKRVAKQRKKQLQMAQAAKASFFAQTAPSLRPGLRGSAGSGDSRRLHGGADGQSRPVISAGVASSLRSPKRAVAAITGEPANELEVEEKEEAANALQGLSHNPQRHEAPPVPAVSADREQTARVAPSDPREMERPVIEPNAGDHVFSAETRLCHWNKGASCEILLRDEQVLGRDKCGPAILRAT